MNTMTERKKPPDSLRAWQQPLHFKMSISNLYRILSDIPDKEYGAPIQGITQESQGIF
jgi:hypothetical protein